MVLLRQSIKQLSVSHVNLQIWWCSSGTQVPIECTPHHHYYYECIDGAWNAFELWISFLYYAVWLMLWLSKVITLGGAFCNLMSRTSIYDTTTQRDKSIDFFPILFELMCIFVWSTHKEFENVGIISCWYTTTKPLNIFYTHILLLA